MSKRIARIPLSDIDRIELRVTHCRKSLAQVKQETGADYILNGGMWNGDGSACPLLKAGGVWYSEPPSEMERLRADVDFIAAMQGVTL